jgi:hypothetical protein
VVLVRSYSFISGSTDQDAFTATPGNGLAHGALGGLLVRGIRVAIDEADRDHLRARRGQALGRAHDASLVERPHHRAVGPHAFIDFEPPPARHQRHGLLPREVVEVRRPHAADLQHVAEAARGDEPGDGADLLEDGVGCHRGAVDDLRHRVGLDPGGAEQCGEARHHREAGILRRGRDLADAQGAVGQLQDDVREGSTDVDADVHGAECTRYGGNAARRFDRRRSAHARARGHCPILRTGSSVCAARSDLSPSGVVCTEYL